MINLDRMESIGKTKKDYTVENSFYKDFSSVEVLNKNKVHLHRCSFVDDDGFYLCPSCNHNTIKLIIEYRCVRCASKVIKWNCYNKEESDEHENYNFYVRDFQERWKKDVAEDKQS